MPLLYFVNCVYFAVDVCASFVVSLFAILIYVVNSFMDWYTNVGVA
jgi:hypothetical protein